MQEKIKVQRVEGWRLIANADRVEYQPFTRQQIVRPEDLSKIRGHRDAGAKIIVLREFLGAVGIDNLEHRTIEAIHKAIR